jgi:hypothetical protein
MIREEKVCRVFVKTIIRKYPHLFHATLYVAQVLLGIRAVDPEWERVGNQIRFRSGGVRFVARYVHRVPDGAGGNTPVHGVEIAAVNSRRQTLLVVTHITSIEDAARWQAGAPDMISQAAAEVMKAA